VTALLVDADRSFVQFAREELNQTRGQPVRLLHAATLARASAILADTPVAVVLLERSLPDGDGLEWLKAQRQRIQAAVLILTSDPRAAEAFVATPGAHDRLVKAHLDGDHLADAIREAADHECTRQLLLHSHEHCESLLERARDLMLVVDAGGRVLYQNPSTASLLGTPLGLHHGVPFAELVHPEDKARARLLIEQLFSEDVAPRGKFRLPHADGSMRTFDVASWRISLGGDGRRAVLNARDITERCQAEESVRVLETELRQAQKMETVGRLAGGIAHDFSNVLHVISAACERLHDDIAQGRARPAQAHVILRHCARATALTRQLLAFSRRQTIAPHPVDLGALIGRARDFISQLIGASITMELDLGDDLRSVEVVPVEMEQVLMNLAINARDAMPGGGLLRVVVRNATMAPDVAALHPPMAPGEYVRLEVIDSGQGMTAEIKARAFEPFFTTKDSSQGTGCGLATVHGIVTESRGYVWIDSAPGRGTRFTIHLPASKAQAEGEPAQEVLPQSGQASGGTILVTEDDPDLRRLLGEFLTERGYLVVEAGSPAEAATVAAAHGGPIDLLLADLSMPGGSGLELARSMKADAPRLKVLYMSGDGEPGPGRKTGLEPGDLFLAKPFTREQLLHAVNGLLG
jgi:PAS domain S-box-containing protein